MSHVSPSVRNLVKNFEHNISPLSPSKPSKPPSKSWTRPRNSKSYENELVHENTSVSSEGAVRTKDREKGDSSNEVIEESPDSTERHFCTKPTCDEEARLDISLTSNPACKTNALTPVDKIAQNRKMLIAGLKEQLKSNKTPTPSAVKTAADEKNESSEFKGHRDNGEALKDRKMTKLKCTPVNGGLPTNMKVTRFKHDSDEQVMESGTRREQEGDAADFTISLSSINSLPTPTHSDTSSDKLGADDDVMTSIVSHCQSAASKFTPMRQRDGSGMGLSSVPSTNCAQPADIEQISANRPVKGFRSEKLFTSKDQFSKPRDAESSQCDEEEGCEKRKNFDSISDISSFTQTKAMRPSIQQTIQTIMEAASKNCLRLFAYGTSSAGIAMNTSRRVAANIARELRRVPGATRTTVKCVADVNQETMIAFSSLAVSMASNIYPTVPRCNAALSSMTIFYSAIQEEPESKIVYQCLLSVNIFSIGLDIDWLISDYFPSSLDINQDQAMYNYKNDASFSRTIAWYLIIINTVLKIAPLIILLQKSDMGSKMLSTSWAKLHLFLPPVSKRLPQDTKAAIQSRIIAIIWMEFISSLLILFFTIYAKLRLSWAPQLHPNAIMWDTVTLFNSLYAKGICGLLFAMAITKNCSKRAILSEFGCVRPSITDDTHKVLIDSSFFKFNGTFKIFNTILGSLTWYSLLSAWNLGGREIPKEVRLVLGFLTTSMVLTDILAASICITVACYVCTTHDWESSPEPPGVVQELAPTSTSRNPSFAHDTSTSLLNNDFPWNGTGTDHARNRALSSMAIPPLSDTSRGKYTYKAAKPRIDDGYNSNSYEPMILTLDDHVSFEPSTFSHHWKQLRAGKVFHYNCNNRNGNNSSKNINNAIPSMEECNLTFEKHRFFPVASGVRGSATAAVNKRGAGACVMTFFLIARCKQQKSTQKCSHTIAFCEIQFKPIPMHLKVEIKLSSSTDEINVSHLGPHEQAVHAPLIISPPTKDPTVNSNLCCIALLEKHFLDKLPLHELFGATNITNSRSLPPPPPPQF